MIAIIYSSFPSRSAALEMGKKLIESGIIACSNVFKVDSQYIWKGEFHEEEEYGAYFKTTIEKKNEAVKFINKNHPYDIPMISSHDVVVNNAYKAWMDSFLNQ